MSQKNLLHWAAKAADIKTAVGIAPKYDDSIIQHNGVKWNSLKNKIDAFDLVTKLGLSVNIEIDIGTVCVSYGWSSERSLPEYVVTEVSDGDIGKTTCLAITKLAAMIGIRQTFGYNPIEQQGQ